MGRVSALMETRGMFEIGGCERIFGWGGVFGCGCPNWATTWRCKPNVAFWVSWFLGGLIEIGNYLRLGLRQPTGGASFLGFEIWGFYRNPAPGASFEICPRSQFWETGDFTVTHRPRSKF